MYNFYAIDKFQINSIAPDGYRVATISDVVELIDYIGGVGTAGGKLKSTIKWQSPNVGATDEYGFTAVPAGYRNELGSFLNKLLQSRIWIDNR